MFNKILIANRGEVAVRIIRACKELGIQTVAVYSLADRDSLHVKMANDAICIGKAASSESYLNIPSIISAAEIADVEAIHPGFGFLAENAHFAEICESCQIKFIGPSPDVIRQMGDKALARDTVKKIGVPLVSGSPSPVETSEEALIIAKKLQYPVIIKARAGGGGKGMKIAHNDGKLVSAFLTARAEAEASFGDASVYIEKYLDNPRHIEVQILADQHGHVVHLGERDCSIQRRHQKLIEEAPALGIDKKLKKKMFDSAIKIAKTVNYHGLGTIEFLVDDQGNYFFIEMNTRLQVEHPVTEMITGLDLVKEQIKVAAGEKLSFTQDQVTFRGHSIECRVNAEDPNEDFRPCPGKIEKFIAPGGPNVRMDSHVYAGYTIPPYYDSMIGKIIVWGVDRHNAILTMQRAIEETLVDPIKTTLPLHKRILHSPAYHKGEAGTHFVEQWIRNWKGKGAAI